MKERTAEIFSEQFFWTMARIKLNKKIEDALARGPLYRYIKADYMAGRLSDKGAIAKIEKINRYFFNSSCPMNLLRPEGYVRSWEAQRQRKHLLPDRRET